MERSFKVSGSNSRALNSYSSKSHAKPTQTMNEQQVTEEKRKSKIHEDPPLSLTQTFSFSFYI